MSGKRTPPIPRTTTGKLLPNFFSPSLSRSLMSRRVLCKFFAHGTCINGEHCHFSHDWNNQPNNVCTFYQKGTCTFGSRCRYDHVKVSHHPAYSSSSSNSHPFVALNSNQPVRSYGILPCDEAHKHHLSGLSDFLPSDAHILASGKPVRTTKNHQDYIFQETECSGSTTLLADQPICSFAAGGSCSNGENCPHIHGDFCSICGKQCLHPYRPDESEEHIKLCQENSKRLETLRVSQDIECSVCFEHVLSKPIAAERKFGLLPECDHPFCISCIRNWRSSTLVSGMEVRACPVCRKLSYFVVPSVIWFSTKEEKQDIIENYKTKLKSIDCKYFDFGNGMCPFGESCFYKHTYKPWARRPPGFSPRIYRPRANRRNQLIIEEELEDFARLVMAEDELVEVARHLDVDDELSDIDENVSDLVEMTCMLMHSAFGIEDYSSDDES